MTPQPIWCRIATAVIATAAGAAGAAEAAMAADDTILDARLGVGAIPGISSAEISESDTVDFPAGGSRSRARSWDASEHTTYGAAFYLGGEYGRYLSGNWGWVAGAQLLDGTSKGTASHGSPDVTASSYGIEFNAGSAYRLNRAAHLELSPFLGVGRSRTTIGGGILEQSSVAGDASGTGSFLDYGIRLSGFYDYDEYYQMGLYLGYEGFRARSSLSQSSPVGPGVSYMVNGVNIPIASTDTDNGSATSTARGHGLIAGVTVGYSF
jgi:hypothetical protein